MHRAGSAHVSSKTGQLHGPALSLLKESQLAAGRDLSRPDPRNRGAAAGRRRRLARTTQRNGAAPAPSGPTWRSPSTTSIRAGRRRPRTTATDARASRRSAVTRAPPCRGSVSPARARATNACASTTASPCAHPPKKGHRDPRHCDPRQEDPTSYDDDIEYSNGACGESQQCGAGINEEWHAAEAALGVLVALGVGGLVLQW